MIEAAADIRSFAHRSREMYEALLQEKFEARQAMDILTTFIHASIGQQAK